MAKSSGMMSLPSPMTTKRRTPSMPGTVRLNCPLYHVPTSPSCLPYLRKTASSTIHRHCQRLWVEALLSWVWRQMERSISRPRRRSRFSQDRLGRAPSSLDGTCLFHPRTRVSSWPCRHPKSVGNMRPTILPSSFCWRSEEHTSELQSRLHLVCRLLLEKKKAIDAVGVVFSCSAAPSSAHAQAGFTAVR